MLTVCAEVYHCHFEELDKQRRGYLLELVAAKIEVKKREEAAWEKAKAKNK